MSQLPSDTNLPESGGGLPIIDYWARKSVAPNGIKLWQTLNHKSACLSCAWGTGGQNGGFVNEAGEYLQRCAKSVEAIAAELQSGIKEDIFKQKTISELQQLTSKECDKLGRLQYPMILRKGSEHYERISWKEVFEVTEVAFKQPPERVASYSSGRSSNEAAYLLQLMMRAMDSNNLADCSDLCHVPSSVALKQVFGSGTSMVSLENLKKSDCVVLIGSNAPANHPRLMNELIEIRERGGQVIIINPQIEIGLVKFASPAFPIKSMLKKGSDISNLYLQPIPGSDAVLLIAIQKSLIEQDLVEFDYLKKYTEGWQDVISFAKTTSWETLTEVCGLSREEIEEVAYTIGSAKNVVFAWAMGITQQKNGTDNVKVIANTALMTGNAGREGAGTMPIRGHSNVQGFGSMGVTIRLSKELKAALEKLLDRPLKLNEGYDARGLMEAADAGKVDSLFCLGGNFYGANPDHLQGKRALGKVETIFYVSTKPNQGHFHGLGSKQTLILPVFNRFENPHKTTTESGNNFVRLNDVGKTHLKGDLISEVDLITEIAHRIHGEGTIAWRKLKDTEYVRELIAQTISDYHPLKKENQPSTEFLIENRIFEEPKFATESGLAQMEAIALPTLTEPTLQDFQIPENTPAIALILGSGRSYGQHNTVVYQEGDKYRGMPHRHCILMNMDDIKKAGFTPNQKVTVQGDRHELENIEIIPGAIREGATFMFYPESNCLFGANTDPKSGIPAFKRVPIAVYAP
ncbi:oxidoreductase alpha (molybdopterin) subunit [[Leptolyngbya] sp. PCC 7376]|uniref:FdhF/YdeP family oxidoreductase n=1 Tax=[Leptolyngbya] sp. PCC 7376 TaxID=111781 RepID=UPI00029F28C8|nr:FdhF/YdeP family oxidoreductase [[Leptolyngbya] sp. PCC 7376]AFY40407.1 oxidoreductase alpha (molybdopterin) subunit [[Leptolyngbya] sp. PCC 7376]